MKIRNFGLEFPKEKTTEALYDYLFRLTEVLDIILSALGGGGE